ncbi:MAG: cytosolic protein [Bacteroidetes bacterium]|nr:cytosolic protein [Bacteroidota bacterium]
MIDKSVQIPQELDQEGLARLTMDFLHRTMMHHALWYAEVIHQLGQEKAFEVLDKALALSSKIQLTRIGKTLGFEMKDDIPAPFLEMDKEKLAALKDALAINWLANDGVWFQAVEFSENMFDAKRCNDSCWAQFSPLEAWSIKRFLGLEEYPGLEGLKRALQFRLYGSINKQSFAEETDNSFLFLMNDCRVQSARKRKGLDDYPCKSGGMIEYSSFAKGIDSRIKSECIGCPPDAHPEEWYCAWRFTLVE